MVCLIIHFASLCSETLFQKYLEKIKSDRQTSKQTDGDRQTYRLIYGQTQ